MNDLTVAFVTAALEMSDPFVDQKASGIQIHMDEQYSCLIRDYSLPLTPPKPPHSAVWLKRLFPRPFLPIHLHLRYPWNLVMYISLPVVIPAVISLVIFRISVLSLASRSSRVRIKQLEEEAHTTGQQKLTFTLAELEREVEEATVDLIDSPDDLSSPIYRNREQPIISPNHKKIVNWLNLLPIKKEIAYFPEVWNSHPIIVCRDVKHFESHRKGEGVLRHWANSFIL